MEDASSPELPAMIARMWGRGQVSRRGPKPSLDLDRITRAALEIGDNNGLEAVSMGNVAKRLGVAPMSLYRYVGSKDELLLALMDAATEPPPPRAGLSRREYLYRWTRGQADLLIARPWLLPVAHNGPPLGPRGLLWLEHLLAALEDTPLDDGEKIIIATTLTGYGMNEASLFTALERPSERNTQPATADAYGELVAELVDGENYPLLARAARNQGFSGADGAWIAEDDFRFGMELLLDGIDALIARRSKS